MHSCRKNEISNFNVLWDKNIHSHKENNSEHFVFSFVLNVENQSMAANRWTFHKERNKNAKKKHFLTSDIFRLKIILRLF